MPIAITRRVSPAMARCELSHVEREEIDLDLAARQHADYVESLRALGCSVNELPEEPELADSVFVEDIALVLDEVAVLTRPGAESRRPESASIEQVLAAHRPLLRIEAPGTLDGGDVMRIGRTLYVGLSGRSNQAAITQLRSLLAPWGYEVQEVAIHGCLHLKSAVTCVAEGLLLVQPDWIDVSPFGSFRLLTIDPSEPHAANTLRIGEKLIYPDCFPRTTARLREEGIEVHTVAVSELQKAEGAVTCCSLVFEPLAV
jgi:dimethylargininase